MRLFTPPAHGPVLLVRLVYLGVLAAAMPILVWNGLAQQFNANLADVLIRLRGPIRSTATRDIVLVAIDDTTASRYGPLPLRRSLLAQGIERLAAFHPKAIAIDLLLAEPGRPVEDEALQRALSGLSSVVLGAALRSDTPSNWILPPPEFADSHMIGHVHAEPDPDGNVRSVLLEVAAGGKRFWALALQAVRLATDAGVPVEKSGSLELGPARIPAARASSRLLLINYAGPEGTFHRVPFSSLLDNTAAAADFQRKIVFLGVTAQGGGDRLFTPFSSRIGMSGIEIHANIARTILDRDYLMPLGEGAQLGVLTLLGATCVLAIGRLRGMRLYGALFALGASTVLACVVAIRFGHLWPVGTLVTGFALFAGIAGVGEYAVVASSLRRSERRQHDYAFRVQAIAHEIKTPLTAIQGSSEIISDRDIPDEQRSEIAGMIHRESKRLTQIVHAFLDVERIAAGAISLQAQVLDLAVLCADVLERARLYAARKSIAIDADIPHVSVDADADLLSFAIYNLLTNAVKYSPRGTTVRIVAERGNDEVAISVVDSGCGIAPAEQRKIFDRFYRVARGHAAAEEGTGIGLAMVKEIVAQHGGRIQVDSREGAGSRFTITLPDRSR